MKKWALRIYVVAVHLMLFAAIGYIVWTKSVIANLPMRAEWHWGSTYTNHPMAMAFPDIEHEDTAILKIGDERIGVISFERDQLNSIYFGWPGSLNQYSITANGVSISTDRDVLTGGQDQYFSTFWDLDDDGIFEIERQDEADERALRRPEWKTVWREDRLPDGSSGPREYFDPQGRLVFRVTENLPPLAQGATPSQIAAQAFSVRPTYLVERFEEGEVVSAETLTEEEHGSRDLVSESGHPPRAEWSRRRDRTP